MWAVILFRNEESDLLSLISFGNELQSFAACCLLYVFVCLFVCLLIWLVGCMLFCLLCFLFACLLFACWCFISANFYSFRRTNKKWNNCNQRLKSWMNWCHKWKMLRVLIQKNYLNCSLSSKTLTLAWLLWMKISVQKNGETHWKILFRSIIP